MMTKLSLSTLACILTLLLATGCYCLKPCCPHRPCPPTPCCDMRPDACPKSHCCAKSGTPQANNGQASYQQGYCQQGCSAPKIGCSQENNQGSCQQGYGCAPKPSSPQDNNDQGSNQPGSCQQGSCQQGSCQQGNCEQNSCQQNGCRHCVHYRDCPHDPNYHDLD